MAYLTFEDFINKFELTVNDYNEAKITSYITRYEDELLIELFGVELYDLFVYGIVAEYPIYEKLQDPFNFQDECDVIHISRGVKDMLLCLIYYIYLNDDYTQQSINSKVKGKSENSEKASLFDSRTYDRYNEGIKTHKAIQAYICSNLDVYPTFKGKNKPYIYFVW